MCRKEALLEKRVSVMVDQEVVDILADIKQRVGATQNKLSTIDATTQSPSTVSQPIARHDYAGLSVLARAWDRLPPLISNRTGSSARLELWLKAKLRTAFRWFTWEQVNFNAATHQTLVEIVDSLKAHEQNLEMTHNQLEQMREALTSQKEALTSQKEALINQVEQHRFESMRRLDQQQAEFNAQRALITSQRADLLARVEALRTMVTDFQSASASEAEARLAELVNEFRARDERLLDEQRVCFKQLSLEMTESQVLEDRARRDLDARLRRLESETGKG